MSISHSCKWSWKLAVLVICTPEAELFDGAAVMIIDMDIMCN